MLFLDTSRVVLLYIFSVTSLDVEHYFSSKKINLFFKHFSGKIAFSKWLHLIVVAQAF